jgi:nitrite reductase (NO-forming)
MKKYYFFILTAFLYSCQQNTSENRKSYVYGSPEATVSNQATAKGMKGPLGYGPEVPAAQAGDTVEVKFDVQHKRFHVKNDVAYTAWMFGDSVPGPILHIRVGQVVKFSMTNRSNEAVPMAMDMDRSMDTAMGHAVQMPHSIDFHAAMVNPEDKYRTVNPGETIHFMWTANYPGVFMYHCGTPMVLMHMIYGMIGMVIVDPKDGFPGKVDHEFAFIQNEYYLKKINDSTYLPDTAKARIKQPSFVTFNGKVAQYNLHPIHVKAGDRIRIYFMNDGPNNATSFHVIGTIFDKVWLDGNPHNELQGMQAVYLGPACGAIMEFVLPEKGRYTFVDHSFADAEMGAIGQFVAE